MNESEPGDETPMFVDQAIDVLLPIFDDYMKAVEEGGGDPDNALAHLKALIIDQIEKIGL